MLLFADFVVRNRWILLFTGFVWTFITMQGSSMIGGICTLLLMAILLLGIMIELFVKLSTNDRTYTIKTH